MTTKLAITLAGVVAASAALSAPAMAEGITLSVTTTYAGEDSNAQIYKDSVAAWEEESGNKVDDSSATSDEAFKSRIVTDFEFATGGGAGKGVPELFGRFCFAHNQFFKVRTPGRRG